MFGSENIYEALNVSAITTGLDSYRTSLKALFSNIVIPKDFTGEKSIKYYMSTPFNAALSAEIYNYIADCRAATYGESRTIANSIINNVNRKSYGDFYITCSIMGTIQPEDDTDNFNTPVLMILKKR